MKYDNQRKSSNIEDKRGQTTGGGGLGGLPISIKGGGGLGLLILLLFLFFGKGDLGNVVGDILGMSTGYEPQTTQVSSTETSYQSTTEEDERLDMLSVVLAYTEDVWKEKFQEIGKTYTPPKLVIYSESVSSGCGVASASSGPFYCPSDQKVYIDLNFYDELSNKYGAPGDFAMAYVLAHEVGHHVQQQLGVADQMEQLRRKLSESEYRKYEVCMELQADYYAGVVARHIQGKGYLEEGDVDEALQAAFSVGDDTLQKKYQGYVVQDTFTHGTSAQRTLWFKRGFEYADFEHGDTFHSDLDNP